MRTTGKFFTLIWIVIASLALTTVPSSAGTDGKTTEIFLVRHAEKAGGKNPPLTAAGEKRANELAMMLRDANVQYVHSTDYARTQQTAAPLAVQQGLRVRLYDPGDLTALANKLRRKGRRHLVVGHSNTTPELVELLGGEAGGEIDEAGEYDRLYVVSIDKKGEVTTVLLRYGQPYISP